MKLVARIFVTAGLLVGLCSCASTPAEYNRVFDAQHTLKQNQAEFSETQDTMAKLVTQTLVKQGFSVESSDAGAGIIKASRVIPDKDDKEVTYDIHLTANLIGLPGNLTSVTVAANQKSTLRHESTVWWHLLWMIPIIPVGHEYQTALLNEGSINDPTFYAGFFDSLKSMEADYAEAARIEAAKLKKEREAAERAAKLKAEKEAREAAARAAAEKAAAEKAAAERASAEKAAAEKAAAEKAAAEKAAAEKAAAEKAAVEKAAAEQAAAAQAAAGQNAAGTTEPAGPAAGNAATVPAAASPVAGQGAATAKVDLGVSGAK